MKPYFISKISFQKPAIGPKDYICTGPSGWPERFSRSTADAELVTLLAPVTVAEALRNFVDSIKFENDGRCSWTEVTRYLGKLIETKPDDVPFAPAIALWGQFLLQTEPEYMHVHAKSCSKTATTKPPAKKIKVFKVIKEESCETEST